MRQRTPRALGGDLTVNIVAPSLAAYSNPAGNGNRLYTGETFTRDNVKNTDAFDPGSAKSATSAALTHRVCDQVRREDLVRRLSEKRGSAFNCVSTSDVDIVLKGSKPRDLESSGHRRRPRRAMRQQAVALAVPSSGSTLSRPLVFTARSRRWADRRARSPSVRSSALALVD